MLHFHFCFFIAPPLTWVSPGQTGGDSRGTAQFQTSFQHSSAFLLSGLEKFCVLGVPTCQGGTIHIHGAAGWLLCCPGSFLSKNSRQGAASECTLLWARQFTLQLLLTTSQPLIFLSYCLELYLLWGQLEEMALSISQTLNSKSWAGMCELLRALSDSCCTCDPWVRKLEAMKPLERLSATLFTLPKFPKAHSEMCFGAHMFTVQWS